MAKPKGPLEFETRRVALGLDPEHWVLIEEVGRMLQMTHGPAAGILVRALLELPGAPRTPNEARRAVDAFLARRFEQPKKSRARLSVVK